MPGFLTASLAPRIRHDFAFGDSALGLSIALFYVVSAVGSIPAGRLVDRLGAGRGTALVACTTGACCVGVALLAHSAAGLAALLLLGGVGNALGSPTVSTLLKREVAGRKHGLAFGAQQSGASLGALLAGLALPAVAIPFGWRWAYVGAAVLTVVACAAAPRWEAVAAATPRGRRTSGLTSVHALGLAAVLASAAGVGFVSFLVSYSVDHGLSDAEAGLLLGGVSLMATLSRIGLGVHADRASQEPLRPVTAMLAASVIGYLLLITGTPGIVVAAALFTGALGWAWPGGLNLAVVQRCPDAPAWAVGVLMTGLFTGAVIGPLIVGLLAEHDLFAEAWGTCATFALLAAATLAATRRAESRV
ncbi:MAG TPA: MFS transporter [Thermoleophilaceae bacterium]